MIEALDVQTPPWIAALVEVVKEATAPLWFMGPLGYRWWEPGNPHSQCSDWLIITYPAPYLVEGGAVDGGRCSTGFQLDVSALLEAFSSVSDVQWHAPVGTVSPADCPSLRVHGCFAGKQVHLCVNQFPPEDEPEAFIYNAQTSEVIRT